jgi:arginine exporter protein ArgO
LLKGILTALIMTVGVGPGMLINFHTSLRRGFVAGLFVVAGLYASDFTFIAINYFGVFRVIQSFQHQRTGTIVCGSVLCIFGIVMLLKKPAAVAAAEESRPLARYRQSAQRISVGLCGQHFQSVCLCFLDDAHECCITQFRIPHSSVLRLLFGSDLHRPVPRHCQKLSFQQA